MRWLIGASENMKHGKRGGGRARWESRLLVAAIALAFVNAQDISICCDKADKAEGTCRSVCEKMSQLNMTTDRSVIEQSTPNIYKFCGHHLTEFWICMNQTIQEVVSGTGWWGQVCCQLSRSSECRAACASALDAKALTESCRRSDEIAMFDCMDKQQEAQWCCSQTQSVSCHEACQKVLRRLGHSRIDGDAKEAAVDACEQSPELLHCLRDLTSSTVVGDTSKYLPCCHESDSQSCRSTCESVLRRTSDIEEIVEALGQDCGAPAIHNVLWQCFLRKDAPTDTKDLIPRDVANLHCCLKAKSATCKELCFHTFNKGSQEKWDMFDLQCLDNSQETMLSQCLEDVRTPCSLGCSSLTYCSQLNDRHTTMFRSCNVRADLDAHLSMAEQEGRRTLQVAGMHLPVKNSSECSTDLWKSVACVLHVKPCTTKGLSSLLCEEDCVQMLSSCVDWAQFKLPYTANTLCARIVPQSNTTNCVSLQQYMKPSTSRLAAPASRPCAGAPCGRAQLCRADRNCALAVASTAAACRSYHCLDGCPLGEGNSYVVPIGAWVRVFMSDLSHGLCFKICKCEGKGLTKCQPLPCFSMQHCFVNNKLILHGEKFYMECNACVCVWGERVCARRACGARRGSRLTRLPCNCPPHHLPAHTNHALYPNACLARCVGATDAEIEFGVQSPCAGVTCPRRHVCVPSSNVCLSRLQTSCPQHVCVNTTDCNSQAAMPVCDTDGRTHANPCHLVMSGRKMSYLGPCLRGCSSSVAVCGANGVTYGSECAAWSEYVSVDYVGPCLAVGYISDQMEPKCTFDRIVCPALKKDNCQGFTAPGACCPRCGGALRILYSKKQIDRALYGTNISATVVNLHNVVQGLERHITIAECALRGYLTIETEIFVTIESLIENPTDLQLKMCILEAEKLADMINSEHPLIAVDLSLSALSYALVVHKHPTKGSSTITLSVFVLVSSYFSVYVLR
ncbi:reversion-inducing cysteine-rich protein with Kazal motifs isoform X1 [Bombyx mandarina]|uniref:Reversion-inducing cysteine-rich protein with Kazal motifs isoform X1 n=1 Tax=Bombyx mandarina TaxID=7092 RepID=A0A6J2JI31_BOMMA|nr:reversion-inducing cysteine-rich protein with Kazal motifs isoform X1 [Bombyx mandarina]XP_028029215.1 reversion-inducing cysteine-rich protein with Kazal motifs isoform X1 [Bombyx mandarina]